MRYRIINTRTLPPRAKEAFGNERIGFHDNRYTFPDEHVAFVHVPKTAGTSVSQALGQCPVSGVGMHRPVSILCPPDRFRYVTVLRDPVARVWSYFHMVRADPANPWHTESGDLFGFLMRAWEARNMAVRYYSGHPHCEANEVTIPLAEANLRRFWFVADFARPNTIAEMVRKLGGEAVGHERKAPPPAIDPESADLIAQFNRADIALYEQFTA